MSLIYLIPPYLVDTAVGTQAQAKLKTHCKRLGSSNVISTDSSYYHPGPLAEPQHNLFCKDKCLNDIIMDKVRYKLASAGVLGTGSMEYVDDTHVGELFHIFERSILESESDTWKGGEVCVVSNSVPETHRRYVEMPLKELLTMARNKEMPSAFAPEGSIRSDTGAKVELPFPTSWTPLFEKEYLRYCVDKLNLVVDNSEGYRTISMRVDANSGTAEASLDWRNKYFNFIGDEAVDPYTGIYYYEVEVEQVATESTNFKPLLLMNDSFISSDRSLNLSVGYIKRHIAHYTSKIDLNKIRREMAEEKSVSDMVLNVRPGEIKGSFALNQEDSAFYNSAKTLERVTNLNRRLSQNHPGPEKIDMGVSFKTRLVKDGATNKVFKTTCVGCGINFVNKSLFITLNGVLVKELTQSGLAGNGDALFGASEPVYPIIGFKLSEIAVDAIDPSVKPGTSLHVRTNLGFKEFLFNVSKYVQRFKSDNYNKVLHLASGFDQDLHLNDLIKDYLNHESYIETFKAFEQDLEFLESKTQPSQSSAQSSTSQGPTGSSEKFMYTHITNRSIIKQYLMTHQFDSAARFLRINYASVLDQYEPELLSMKFVYLLKRFVENPTRDNEVAATHYRMELQHKSAAQKDRIKSLVSLLLVKNRDGLERLSARTEIKDYTANLSKLWDAINSSIMQRLGCSPQSELQKIFDGAERNMATLSTEGKDASFMLVNFEQDHLEQ